MSRGFVNGTKKEGYQSRITPEALQRLLSQETYQGLLDEVEVQAHNAVPQFIRGDFYLITAPNGE